MNSGNAAIGMNSGKIDIDDVLTISDIVDIFRETVSSSNDLLIDSFSSYNIWGGEILFFAPTSLSDIHSVAPSIVQGICGENF